jgi:hypothetical protein
MSSTARPKLSEAERAANVRTSEIADVMKSLRAAELDRTDRIARMLRLYAEAESEAGMPRPPSTRAAIPTVSRPASW